MIGEDALIIHEVFEDNAELKFHLSKGTAEKYKKDIDAVAAPEVVLLPGSRLVDHPHLLQVPPPASHILKPRQQLHNRRAAA